MSNLLPTKPPREPFYTRIITRNDKRVVLQFLQEFFFEEEPACAYLYSIQSENVRYIDRGVFAISCIDEGLSTIALSRSGQIAGVILNATVKSQDQLPANLLERNPIFPIIRKLVVHVDRQIDLVAGVRNPNEKEMDLKMICVHPEWRGQGVGQALLKQTKWAATNHGFSQIRSLCTSLYSAKMFTNFGFQCVYKLRYEDYKVNGKVVFHPAEPHTHVKAMILKID